MSSGAIAARHDGLQTPVRLTPRRAAFPCTEPGASALFVPDDEDPARSDRNQRKHVHAAWSTAKALCAVCPRLADGSCLAEELRMMRAGYRTFGVVAGTVPAERKAMLTPSELNTPPAYLVEPCGSPGGYARHIRNKETACVPCKQAHAAAQAHSRLPRPTIEGRRLVLGPMRRLRAAAYAESCRLRALPALEEARSA